MRVWGDLSSGTARRFPNKVALRFNDQTLTYEQLDRRSNQLARALIASGVLPGDRVALLACNCLEYAIVTQGVAKAGAILVPLNFRLVGPELRTVLRDSEPRVIVMESGFAAVLSDALTGLGSAARIVVIDDLESPNWLTLRAFSGSQAARAPDVHPDPKSGCVIIYTSGTTGVPKGVLLSHESCFRMYAATAIEAGLLQSDVFLMAVPMFHNGGLNLMLHQCLYLGATGVIHRGSFDPAAVFALSDAHGISITVLVPTQIAVLARHPQRAEYPLRSWRLSFYGSMPMPTSVLEDAMRIFPQVGFMQMYGSTEAGMLSVLTWEDHEKHARSTGREALSSHMRIVEGDRDVEVGEVGEVLGEHAGGMIEYWRNEAATAATIVNGWVHTGDRARRERDGFFLVLGRIKEIVNSGGEKIDPTEVENVLSAHPAVREVAVLGLPDATFGESVCAAVIFMPNKSATAAELDTFCRARLAGYKVPRRYEFPEGLPRNASDKVQKHLLRERFTQARSGGDSREPL
jgi:acyl-CoA synthetase (AMP-forming)/AMP-acid ligase II